MAVKGRLPQRKLTFPQVLRLPDVVERCALRGPFGFMAFHGGNLERRTDRIAEEAARRSGSSVYSVIQPDGMRHHFPSATVDPAHSDTLAGFIDHCEVVIAVHGYGRHGHWEDLLCGGQNRELALHAAEHLRAVLPDGYNVITHLGEIPKALRGIHPRNPVNRPKHKGMQLELPPGVRGLTPLADRYPPPFPHLEAVIDGLARAARSWPSASTSEGAR